MPREQRMRNEQIARGDNDAADHDGKSNSVGWKDEISIVSSSKDNAHLLEELQEGELVAVLLRYAGTNHIGRGSDQSSIAWRKW